MGPMLHRPLSRIEAALVAEACAKSDVVWLRPVEGERAWAVWHVWGGTELCVLGGPGEQQLPPMTGVLEVIVPSKDTGARIVTFLATVRSPEPGSTAWQEAATALAAARLNAADVQQQQHRWATEAHLHLLHPVGVTSAVTGDEDAPDGRLVPPDNPGTTMTRRPFHLGRRRRRARRLGHGS